MTSSGGRKRNNFDIALFACLMYKLLTINKGGDFCQLDLLEVLKTVKKITVFKTTEWKCQVTIFLVDVFDFAKHLENPLHGLWQEITPSIWKYRFKLWTRSW